MHLQREQCRLMNVCSKAAKGWPVDEWLQAFRHSRDFPGWLTITMSPKGSYREGDVIAFLGKHLDPWKEGRDWRIILADDYSAHRELRTCSYCFGSEDLLSSSMAAEQFP